MDGNQEDPVNSDTMVYEAERVLYSRAVATRFHTIEGAQAYLEHVQATQFFIARWPRPARRTIVLKPSKRYEWAGAHVPEGIVMTPVWAMDNLTILHELSHFCQGKEKQDHGPIFCGVYVSLVGRFVSKEAGRSLKLSYRAYGVEVSSI